MCSNTVYWRTTKLPHQVVLGLWLILQHQLDAIPTQLSIADWTGKRKECVVSLRNFPQIQQNVFYSAFFFVLPIQAMCVRSIHMALVWLGKVDFSLFLPVVINYTDIVLAQIVRGLLDSFGGSSKVGHWSLISALDFNIPFHGPSGALVSVDYALLGHAWLWK